MPWLGDGTWVQNANLAREIIQGRTNYRPWSGETENLTICSQKLLPIKFIGDKMEDVQPKNK